MHGVLISFRSRSIECCSSPRVTIRRVLLIPVTVLFSFRQVAVRCSYHSGESVLIPASHNPLLFPGAAALPKVWRTRRHPSAAAPWRPEALLTEIEQPQPWPQEFKIETEKMLIKMVETELEARKQANPLFHDKLQFLNLKNANSHKPKLKLAAPTLENSKAEPHLQLKLAA
ncbi:pyrophosphate--fructose 6-phosphate1-phosphotransferase subunit beta 1 [Striga asiatica]|uniref:Pyrophosphate--fructose 6-phosphate1-phosphotransferase subunit beta 1 n=1 Tax=Striga asiatica TaxID=4170 RepID=A0A5A7PIH4_STRAF|nr:pyrophosphate--fructose 6-phosphate1-phosphotransferase subunit beta 1 [Striga asiatica]